MFQRISTSRHSPSWPATACLLAAYCTAGWAAPRSNADEPPTSRAESPLLASQSADEAVSQPGQATIVGHVRYRGDAARPWRLGRYYLRSSKTGELAEAVVAIAKRGLHSPGPARAPRTETINQKDFQFTPETLAIQAGDRVRFLNSDAQIHNVQTSHSRQSFNVNMPPGGEHIEAFSFAGGTRQPYRLGCVYHGGMRAWVFVFDHPWFQLTDKTGSFRLTDVPPGEYRLEVVHPAGELRADRMITLNPDETLSVEFQLTPDDRVDNQP